jgi:uncharacterized protein (TIGR03067 family)
MVRGTALVIVVAWLTAAVCAEDANEITKRELVRFAGKWRIVSTVKNGEEQPPAAEVIRIAIVEDRILVGDKDVGLRIAVMDAAVKPHIIDVTHPETKKKLEGVYELVDDRWRICLNSEGTAERPAGFDTQGKAHYVLAILEREK